MKKNNLTSKKSWAKYLHERQWIVYDLGHYPSLQKASLWSGVVILQFRSGEWPGNFPMSQLLPLPTGVGTIQRSFEKSVPTRPARPCPSHNIKITVKTPPRPVPRDRTTKIPLLWYGQQRSIFSTAISVSYPVIHPNWIKGSQLCCTIRLCGDLGRVLLPVIWWCLPSIHLLAAHRRRNLFF